MSKVLVLAASACLIELFSLFSPRPAFSADDIVTVHSGKLQGATSADRSVRIFRGIPFAAPPVGDLRWKAPQPPKSWTGVRLADKFGPACLQTNVFGDIYFRDAQPSEDCLNLNIWIPANAASKNLPVFVWYYGGGFVAGANSEPRYDGESLARKGIIVVEPNYRLGVLGFLSYPELIKDSGRNSSGNYGLLDQVAALEWVVKNIAAFGGDPHNITIGGESAGSLSVSALMASPLSRHLFQKALGESGAFFPLGPKAGMQLRPVDETAQAGRAFAESIGAKSLAELRSKTGNELLQAAAKLNNGFAFSPNIDGYFLPADVLTIFSKGEQSHVPLLAGWNADEGKIMVLMSPQKPTAKSFPELAHAQFNEAAPEFLKLYPASTDAEAFRSAADFSGDTFIAFSTWKWLDMQLKTGSSPVYQYLFQQVPKTKPGAMMGPLPAIEAGSKHAGEIEYVFETLKSQEGVTWADDDFKISELMANYWVTFIKTGNSPVYQYLFQQIPKTKPGAMMGPLPAIEAGSKHAGEIEYVFETLKSQEGVTWADDDFKISELMANYWVTFIKTGNPNGSGLPNWPASFKKDGYQVMYLNDSNSHAAADSHRARYEFLDTHAPAPPK